MNNRRRLERAMVLVFLPLLLGVFWVFATPTPINGVINGGWGNFHPDEGSHISVIRYMAMHPFTLPPYVTPYDTSVHPPLYHGISAIIFRCLTPFLTESDALRVVRLFSVLTGVGTCWFAYCAARQTRLGRTVAVLIGILVALVPMRAAISGAVSNENLAALGATASLAFLFEAIRFGFTPRRYAALIFWCVVAIGSKITCVGLILAIGVALLVYARRKNEPIHIPLVKFLFLLAAIGIMWGWWFVYNTRHFGDPLRKAAADRMWNALQPGFKEMSVTKGVTASHYFFSLVANGWGSFWGYFDGMAHRFPLSIFLILMAVQLLAFLGLALRLPKILHHSSVEATIWTVTGIFVAFVALVYFQYNWAHYTPQGRYFFVLLAPFGILMVGGLQGFLRRSLPQPWHRSIYLLLGIFLFLLNVYAVYVMPRYELAKTARQ